MEMKRGEVWVEKNDQQMDNHSMKEKLHNTYEKVLETTFSLLQTRMAKHPQTQ